MHQVTDEVRITYGHDGAVLLDIRRDRVLRFNLTASMILKGLEQCESITTIADAVSRKFSISRERAQADVGDFVESMEKEGLLRSLTCAEEL